jgi:hypothetical protein
MATITASTLSWVLLALLGFLELYLSAGKEMIGLTGGLRPWDLVTIVAGLAGYGLIVGATFGLTGLWRGKRHRDAAYLAFTLSRVSPSSRSEILNYIYAKAKADASTSFDKEQPLTDTRSATA